MFKYVFRRRFCFEVSLSNQNLRRKPIEFYMASILINSGKDVVSVSKRLGHAKVSTTTDIYSHIIMEADEQASECLADVMLRPTKKRAAV